MPPEPEYLASVWGYEMHFQVSAQTKAEFLFQRLDPTLAPGVLLVAIPSSEIPSQSVKLIQRENDVAEDVFTNLLSEVEQIAAEHPDRVSCNDPRLQAMYDDRVFRASVAEAVQIRLGTVIPPSRIAFCSLPADLCGFRGIYRVVVALLLDRCSFERCYALKSDRVDERHCAPRSLLDATVACFLRACTGALSESNAGVGTRGLSRPEEEFIREAGKELMARVAWVAGGIEGVHFLFDRCNALSAMKYEGEASSGGIVVATQGDASIETIVDLATPISLIDNVVAARKLLETSSAQISLVSDSERIFGLGRIADCESTEENVFSIQFVRQNEWQLQHGGKPLMTVRNGVPELPRERVEKQDFEICINTTFGSVGDDAVNSLWSATEAASQQKHGTMLVISENASAEALRLSRQGMRLVPQVLSRDVVALLTGIDGALLLDTSGVCHAIGVILDGRATERGDPSRGARYNSAIRYVESNDAPTVAVVISEDGRIDLVTALAASG